MFKKGKNDRTGMKMGCGTIALIGLFLCAVIFVLPQMSFGGGSDERVVVDEPENDSDARAQTIADVDLGRLVVAEEVDRNGCPVDSTNVLRNVDDFYVVAPDSEVPEGTDIFVRLYQDNIAIEDLPIITADRDYNSSCINFIFETTDGFAFDSGLYEAEFWVNGNAYDSVVFDIR